LTEKLNPPRALLEYRTLTPSLARECAGEILACSDDVSDWTEHHLATSLPEKWRLSFIASINSAIVGYAIISTKFGRPHLHQFMVRSDLRGSGYGKELLEECSRRCGDFTLKVHADNVGAVRFYERHGLRVSGKSGAYWWMTTSDLEAP
jgi:ribosomal protein S18 acetylase RimI-like enzyme